MTSPLLSAAGLVRAPMVSLGTGRHTPMTRQLLLIYRIVIHRFPLRTVSFRSLSGVGLKPLPVVSLTDMYSVVAVPALRMESTFWFSAWAAVLSLSVGADLTAFVYSTRTPTLAGTRLSGRALSTLIAAVLVTHVKVGHSLRPARARKSCSWCVVSFLVYLSVTDSSVTEGVGLSAAFPQRRNSVARSWLTPDSKTVANNPRLSTMW